MNSAIYIALVAKQLKFLFRLIDLSVSLHKEAATGNASLASIDFFVGLKEGRKEGVAVKYCLCCTVDIGYIWQKKRLF